MHLDNNEQRGTLEDASYRELRLLEEVESTPQVSQRRLARQLGVALGVANVLVRSLGTKGYIRARQVAWKRWAYILTPAGLTRKVHLTFAYIERFVDHYRRVRTMVRQELSALPIDPDSRIAIYGTMELAELMYLAIRELGITRIDVFGQEADGRSFLGMPVQSLDSVVPGDYAAVLVASSNDVDARYKELHAKGILASQIVTLLQNSKHPAEDPD